MTLLQEEVWLSVRQPHLFNSTSCLRPINIVPIHLGLLCVCISSSRLPLLTLFLPSPIYQNRKRGAGKTMTKRLPALASCTSTESIIAIVSCVSVYTTVTSSPALVKNERFGEVSWCVCQWDNCNIKPELRFQFGAWSSKQAGSQGQLSVLPWTRPSFTAWTSAGLPLSSDLCDGAFPVYPERTTLITTERKLRSQLPKSARVHLHPALLWAIWISAVRRIHPINDFKPWAEQIQKIKQQWRSQKAESRSGWKSTDWTQRLLFTSMTSLHTCARRGGGDGVAGWRVNSAFPLFTVLKQHLPPPPG